MNSRGSPLPAEEWTLCLFATWLANDLKAASIKVYLSAVRALHIEQGLPDPLSGCLRLQRVLKGIKRCQGSSSDKRLPVTPAILRAIYGHLDLSQYDDVMFWAACCLAYFGFLRSSEFTVPNGATFSQALHLSVHDIAADQRVAPSRIQANIKVSKTDPFRQGCATSAALAGVPDHLFQTLGRWFSSAYLTYIRTPRSLLSNLTKSLC
jgi:hypothetical protein